jgi:hypothetical protein
MKTVQAIFLLIVLLILSILSLFLNHPASAQASCAFYPVSPALTDLGSNFYQRLVSISPLTYQPTGVIGGLYPGGSNLRPPAHEAAGLAQAAQVGPLDANGIPADNGKIGITSIGMSNTEMEFSIRDPASFSSSIYSAGGQALRRESRSRNLCV